MVRAARNESRHVVPHRHATICNGELRRESNGVEAERRAGPARRVVEVKVEADADRGGPDEQLCDGDSRVSPRAQMQRQGSPPPPCRNLMLVQTQCSMASLLLF